jgi:quinol monooxygenase YgiN
MIANLWCVLLPTVLLVNADDPPIVALVKAKHKDVTKPFALVITIQAQEGKEAQVAATFVPCLKASRKDKGCLLYELHADPDKPRTFVLIERWQNLADLAAHLQADHTQKLLKELPDLLVGPPEVRVLRAVE